MALIGLILGIDTNYGIRSSNLISDFINDVMMSHFGVILEQHLYMALIGLKLGFYTHYGIRSPNLISDFINDVMMSHFPGHLRTLLLYFSDWTYQKLGM